jgi:hypothetical protein
MEQEVIDTRADLVGGLILGLTSFFVIENWIHTL